MIYAVSEVGDMVDFLKNNPSISYTEYMWELSVPMTRLMQIDFSRVRYLSEDEIKMRKGKQLNEREAEKALGSL